MFVGPFVGRGYGVHLLSGTFHLSTTVIRVVSGGAMRLYSCVEERLVFRYFLVVYGDLPNLSLFRPSVARRLVDTNFLFSTGLAISCLFYGPLRFTLLAYASSLNTRFYGLVKVPRPLPYSYGDFPMRLVFF